MAIQIKYQLLFSHGLSAWGDRMWSFSIGLYLVILSPTSLQLTAIYGLILAVSLLLLGSTIGLWIDVTPRLKAAKVALFIQNASVVLCCVLLCLTLSFGTEWEALYGSWIMTLAHAAVILSADVASLFSEAQKIILERDWIVVISGHDPNDLAKMNSMFRTLDLTTLILAPLLVGGIMSWFSQVAAAIFIASWNVVSLVVEYCVLVMIFKRVPELAAPKKLESDSAVGGREKTSWLRGAVHAWKLYFDQPIAVAGVGLACVYMTVLGYDSVTSGYLYSQGVPEWAVGLANGSGALFGILGALLFPVLRRLFTLRTSAVIGFAGFALAATGAVVSAFLPGSPFVLYLNWIGLDSTPTGKASSTNATMVYDIGGTGYGSDYAFYLNPSAMTFMLCLVLSRTALWIADLSVTQGIQETVKASLRGEINGVQSSLNNSMEVLKFGLVAVSSAPNVFGYLIWVSEVFYIIALICSCRYAASYKRRHYESLSHSDSDPPEKRDLAGNAAQSEHGRHQPSSTKNIIPTSLTESGKEYGTFQS